MPSTPLQANKGEWSELYVLFKIIDDRAVAAADDNLEPLEDQSYTFLKIFREDIPGRKYEYNLEEPGNVAIIDSSHQVVDQLSTHELGSKTRRILASIQGADTATFGIPEAETLMGEYKLTKIRSVSPDKADIVAVIKDRITDRDPRLGFSIKSQLGGDPTLLNASAQTNFIYNVRDFSGDLVTINNISGASKIRDRVKALYDAGATLEYVSTTSDTFDSNMRLIDSSFGKIIAEMLIRYYSGDSRTVSDLAAIVGQTSILGMSEHEVSYKIKNFLRALALGMIPSAPWNTYLNTYGGYIVVREDGTLVCYHLYNDDAFKDYLFSHTRFETASSSRHGFGELFIEDSMLKFKLNLQIRF